MLGAVCWVCAAVATLLVAAVAVTLQVATIRFG